MFSHDDTSHDLKSLATVHINGPNSDDIHETRNPNNILDETENVDDLCQLVVAAQVVPDDDEREVEIKERLIREIKEEVEMRLMTEGRPPVVAKAMRAKATWPTRGCVLLMAILTIMLTVTAIVVPSKHAFFEISTCTSGLNFDSGISISTGSCDNLECLASVSYAFDCMDTPYGGATVTFYSEVGVNYFLQVHPVTEHIPNARPYWDRTFTFVVSSGQRPANDVCSSAAVVEANTSPVVGSMSHASWDVTCWLGDWGSWIVWYILIGWGDAYKISTCSSVLNFDSSFSVFTGSCDSLYCMINAEVIQPDCPQVSYRAGTFLSLSPKAELQTTLPSKLRTILRTKIFLFKYR